MSNQNKKSNYEIVLAFVEKEVNKLRDEIAHLLENPITEKDIERIEQSLEELEKIFHETY
ncbi:hypothetical protein [Rickettsia endosymbiont of Pantilius tunicatus]|uniref:hypothetical protein n=1 Tax=Rickettsia endosymbiont of Pantilius tunicatus TaxID=3066267 RepID=UPI0030E2872E